MKKVFIFFITLFVLSTNISFANIIGSSIDGYKDGDENTAIFNSPRGMAYSDGIIYIADKENNMIRTYDIKTKKVSTLVGQIEKYDEYGSPIGGYVDGTLKEARLNKPTDIVVCKCGAIYFVDSGNHAIRKITANSVTTVAGGKRGYKDGKNTEAKFDTPSGITYQKDGSIIIADTLNNAIRKIDTNGNVTTIAKDVLNEPVGVDITKNDILVITDSANQRILGFKNDKLSKLAGVDLGKDEQSGYKKSSYIDSDYNNSGFAFPKGIFIDELNDIYVADIMNSAIRILSNNKVTTAIVSNKTKNLDLKNPYDILVVDNKLYVSDTNKNSILYYDVDRSN